MKKLKGKLKDCPKFSIIIPTLNEEKYIENLLKSVKKQTLQPVEIIVADAGSKDKTREIAKKYGAKVVKGGLPAVGRNAGAKIAKGDILVFLDADAWLPRNTLESLCDEFSNRNIDFILFKYKNVKFDFEKYNKWQDFWNRLGTKVENLYRGLEVKLNKMILGQGIFAIRRRIFNKIGGFDPKITYGEDNYFLLKAIKLAKGKKIQNYKFSNVAIKLSGRRFKHARVILAGWLLLPLFAFAEVLAIFKAYRLRAKVRDFLMSLFYGKLGGG